jgi:hypothetical protein
MKTASVCAGCSKFGSEPIFTTPNCGKILKKIRNNFGFPKTHRFGSAVDLRKSRDTVILKRIGFFCFPINNIQASSAVKLKIPIRPAKIILEYVPNLP